MMPTCSEASYAVRRSAAGRFTRKDKPGYQWSTRRTAEDTPDKIDYERLARVINGVEGVIESLAR